MRKWTSFQKVFKLAMTFDRKVKQSLQMIFDTLTIFAAYVSAMFLRLETFTFLKQPEFFVSYILILVSTIIIFVIMGLYQSIMRYVSTEIVFLLALGSGVSAIFVVLAKLTIAPFIPWSVPIIFGALIFIAVTGFRFILRTMFRMTSKKNLKNIAIYGAGAVGVQILQSLRSSSDYHVQMVLDDNPSLQGQRIYGLKVMSFDEAAANFLELEIDIILLTMPSISIATRQNIISKVSECALQIKTIPGVASLIDGSAKIVEFQDVKLEDLLGRELVNPLPKLLDKNIFGKTVLVTGAGGSIGSELCRQIVNLKPKQLVLIDVSERAIYKIVTELDSQSKNINVELTSLIGTTQDRSFISAVLSKLDVDTIYHAAAYKHVPLMERNIIQAIKNNAIGTMVLAEEAVRYNVTSFTLISTDKAVNPTNVMGASKRLAERVCQAMDLKQSGTRFSMVRFGNVLGSSGSVVPLFQKQIAAGGPITLTHPEVIRYFMTIGEAVQLLIQASSMAKGGEVFVLDMGMPIKIKDLAFKMVQLSGLRPFLETDHISAQGDIAVKITGLRPGEKMYEELTYGDNLVGTAHPRIMTVNETAISPNEMYLLIDKIEEMIVKHDNKGVLKTLVECADYTPDQILLDEETAEKSINKSKNHSNRVVKINRKITK